jgi:hypothetical protein
MMDGIPGESVRGFMLIYFNKKIHFHTHHIFELEIKILI